MDCPDIPEANWVVAELPVRVSVDSEVSNYCIS
jgi:hypothetical protein